MKNRIKKNFKRFVFISFLTMASSTLAKKKDIRSSLALEPQKLETKIDQEHQFIVQGGVAPYKFKTSSGMIRYQNNEATYIAPLDPGEATVTVIDATGASKTVHIKISE